MLRRDWATRFVLPVQNLNVRAMRRFKCLCNEEEVPTLLLPAALEGGEGVDCPRRSEGYNDNVAVMDLLAMHGSKDATPLNVTPRDLLLVLFKEAAGLTITALPTVKHSLMEIINKVNGTAPPEASRQRDSNSSAPVAIKATTVAVANTLANKLTAAKATVTHATSQKDLVHVISLQAQTIAKEAARGREQARMALEEARCARATVINPIEIAQADEQVEITVTPCEMDMTATEKGHIAYGANAFVYRAYKEYEAAVKTLLNLCKKMISNGNGGPSDGSSMSSHGTTTTPRSTSTLSSVFTNAGIITPTPATILPGNPYVRTSSLLHCKTAAAIGEINAPTNSTEDTLMESIKMATPSIGGRRNVIIALKTLFNRGIVEPICQFHACLMSSEQERRISKATFKPALEQAAARIAAVGEAECPTNRPTLKGLIHEDVDKTTKELHLRIHSLELKLVVSSAKNELGGGKKKAMKPKGTVTAPTKKTKPTSQKPKSKKKALTSRKNSIKTSPADNSNVSTTAAKNPKEKKSRVKLRGNGRGKKTAARK